jgi:D-3-phosphoglycerate dehydrogenase/(S)-sulfolactate dehydrogenase
MRVLVTDKADASGLQRIRDAGHEVVEMIGVQGDDLVRALDGADGLLVRSATKVTGEVLRAATTLRVVVRAGTGLDNVDTVAARQKGIAVHNTPNANSISVAELVFGMLLAFERHLVDAAGELRQGRWEKSKFSGHEIAGRRLGLVGFGRIGREVAVRARAFAMEVWACDPVIQTWPAEFSWVRRVSIEELLVGCDVVSLHVPLAEGTRGMIGTDQLARMHPGAVLINCARGGVVDEEALRAALESGRLRGAILDAFAVEPAPADHPLLKLPNVLAAPHLGASTAEAQKRAGDDAATVMIEALAKL